MAGRLYVYTLELLVSLASRARRGVPRLPAGMAGGGIYGVVTASAMETLKGLILAGRALYAGCLHGIGFSLVWVSFIDYIASCG